MLAPRLLDQRYRPSRTLPVGRAVGYWIPLTFFPSSLSPGEREEGEGSWGEGFCPNNLGPGHTDSGNCQTPSASPAEPSPPTESGRSGSEKAVGKLTPGRGFVKLKAQLIGAWGKVGTTNRISGRVSLPSLAHELDRFTGAGHRCSISPGGLAQTPAVGSLRSPEGSWRGWRFFALEL